MLISGTDHHLVGEGTMGAPNDERRGLPGYEGYLNDRSLSVAQLLKDAGYHTYMAGKWHLGSNIATPATPVPLGTAGHTPDQWGFEKSFALMGGAGGNHYFHENANSKNYTENGAYVQPGQPGQPGTGTYSTDCYIDANKGDGKPFFAYAAYTSPHWPLQVPEPWLNRYKGRYDGGYEVIRAARIAKQKALGIIPQDFEPYGTDPETLTSSLPPQPWSARLRATRLRAVFRKRCLRAGIFCCMGSKVGERARSLSPGPLRTKHKNRGPTCVSCRPRRALPYTRCPACPLPRSRAGGEDAIGIDHTRRATCHSPCI
jgi:arylsulfatase A-like enzyme